MAFRLSQVCELSTSLVLSLLLVRIVLGLLEFSDVYSIVVFGGCQGSGGWSSCCNAVTCFARENQADLPPSRLGKWSRQHFHTVPVCLLARLSAYLPA